MARVKISELPELSIATLDTTYVVGTSGSTTYKISISKLTSSLDTTFATDLVVNAISGTINSLATTQSVSALSTSIDNRLDGLETFSSSADNRYILSGSLTQTTWENISGKPNNIVSSSTQISELGFISTSTDLSFLNLFTASQYISNSYFATTGSNTFKGEQIISGAFTVSISGNAFGVNENPTPNNIFWSYIPNDTNTTSIENGWIANIETVGVYTVTNVEYDYPFVKITLDDVLLALPYRCNGYFYLETKELKFESDGVLKITGSLDVSSGITGSTDFNTIVNKPTLISSSTQISSLGFISTSVSLTDLNTISASYLTFTQSYYTDSASFSTRIINAQPIGYLNTSSYQIDSASFNSRIISGSAVAGTISSSAQISGLGYATTSSLNSFTSSYKTDSASFDTRINSIILSSGSNLNYFLEAYANVTYTLPGGFTEDPCRYSVVSVNENVPSNWFNTSSYRFTPQKAGYWEINAAYDVYRNTESSMAIRKNGSIVASAGSFNAVAQDISKIIYLNGSTDYIDIVNTGGAALQRSQYQQRSWFQAKFVGNTSGSTDLLSANNTFTGNNTFEGTTRFETVGGDEGGEIEFGVPQTNTSLSTRVVADVYQNRFRIFDGNTNGVFIDLSKAPIGVAGEIAWKTSGFVNAGTFLTLDNLKVTCTTGGARGLSVGAVSTNFTANIAGWFGYTGGGGGASAYNVAYTTTAAGSAFGWGFNTEGDASNYIITDKTNSRVYRVVLMIGFGFNNNFISIERLH